jgi:chaperonin GroES
VLATATTTKRRADSTKRASASPIGERLSTKHLRPLGDRVVIEPTPHDEMTRSGILIPDTVKEKPQKGTILAVGPGRILADGKREQIDVKKGDNVLYAKYAGTEFKIDAVDLLIVSQKDILAVVAD